MPPQEFDFNSVPTKTFADSVSIRVINGLMHLALQSGKETTCFVLPLPMAKLLGKGIGLQVKEIEDKNGVKFDDRLPNEPMLSPWTSQNPPENNGK